MNVTTTDGVSLNFWLKAAEGKTITSAAVGEATLENGKLTLSDRGNGYWVIAYECGAADLSSLLTLTVNGGAEEFKACPLSYAEKLGEMEGYADLSRAIIEYAYYVSTLCD